ncbi:TetR family transcriptional regulator [Devosia sp. Leaf420]|uniref:TetR-like C-terminal domain-containing protein n=1 Tax=Devosia sp. Leaf420 TaxID=1736374 RepID=UPI0007154221|nr:TetR-like C-terminal domain-containing protein [Devosia sp. Leaf420]KQT45739.1 TetR family transcriptional regulator [Devosia sp. Leaf420]
MERNRSDEKNSGRLASGAAVKRPQITDALSRAFFEEWARVGYARLSLEKVAGAAGVGKAALYRRWSSKAEMASDLLSQVGIDLTRTEDMGSLEADVEALLRAIRRVLRHRVIKRILVDLHAEMGREPALADAIRPFQFARREQANAFMDRAIARGELPPTVDRAAIADFLAAPLYWRLIVLGGKAGCEHIRRLARMIAAAAKASGDE